MKFVIVLFIGLFSSLPAWAQSTLEGCIEDHRLCTSDCLNVESDGTKAACVAQCAGIEAQCAGRFGIEKSEPYIRRKAQELENLLNEFFGDILPELENKTTPAPSQQGATDT